MYNLAHLEYIVTDLTLKTNIINVQNSIKKM